MGTEGLAMVTFGVGTEGLARAVLMSDELAAKTSGVGTEGLGRAMLITDDLVVEILAELALETGSAGTEIYARAQC